MKLQTLTSLTHIALFSVLSVPVQLSAQRTRYKLIDLGTLGGPLSSTSEAQARVLNKRGGRERDGHVHTQSQRFKPVALLRPRSFANARVSVGKRRLDGPGWSLASTLVSRMRSVITG
jgi:hypothetical protein